MVLDDKGFPDACSAGSISMREEEWPKQGCLRGGSPSAMTLDARDAGGDGGACTVLGWQGREASSGCDVEVVRAKTRREVGEGRGHVRTLDF